MYLVTNKSKGEMQFNCLAPIDINISDLLLKLNIKWSANTVEIYNSRIHPLNSHFSVDANFDKHDIPYDVLWLDIEHTNGKR